MTYYVGIDIAKYTHYASIIDSNGALIEEPFSFDNNSSGFKLLLSKLNELDSNHIICGYESTAHYHLNLDSFLRSNGFECVIINPILTKRFRGINIRNVKNDKVDSKSIALFLSFNYSNISKSVSMLDPMYELNILCDHLQSLKKEKARFYIQLTACLDITFPELKKEFFKGNLKTKAAHNLLREFNTATVIAQTRIDKLTSVISKGSKGFDRERVESLKVLAKDSIGSNSLSYSIKISQLIDQIELTERQISKLLDVICKNEFVRDSALLKIPGMGYIQAANILSVIISIDRFSSSKQLLAYAGLDPIIRQSGTFNASSTRMSKRGNSLLRYSLIWTAHNVSKNSNTMHAYYLKKRSEGKTHYNALGHCSKKLVNYIFLILKNPDKDFILE